MTADITHAQHPATAARRPVLRKRALLGVLAAAAAATGLFFVTRPALPDAWATPGSPELYLTGVLGALLTLTPFAFSLAKRSGASENPPAWFVAHVIAASIGVALLVIHSGGHIGRPPALLLVGGLFLVLQGAWARVVLSHKISGVFGGKYHAIMSAGTVDKDRLRDIIAAKRDVLARLDPAADEALFSPTLSHWCRNPATTLRYARLARAEMGLIGQRKAISPMLAYWRALHIAVAFLFLLGMIVHILTVTFFAGYVAEGGPVTWWHLTAWGTP
ncbi:MAG: hypothetical protein GKS00_25810 [Alphaproteobacteria bacterium]|nr:hypothetical protein [Alphaproteobacteria bacterium]